MTWELKGDDFEVVVDAAHYESSFASSYPAGAELYLVFGEGKVTLRGSTAQIREVLQDALNCIETHGGAPVEDGLEDSRPGGTD